MKTYTLPSDMYSTVTQLKKAGKTVGFVPTMGCLHEGHLSLVRAACQRTDHVVASIFVNPTQFGSNEDLSQYPRPLEQDLALLKAEGVSSVFTPSAEVMYGDLKTATFVEVPGLSDRLCGAVRPGHFQGVATIVAKLFHIIPADQAFFGEKDWQQQTILRKMVRDLNIPLELVTCPTVREPDGLAMSSRNTYLSPQSRALAVRLYQALQSAQTAYRQGELQAERLIEKMRTLLLTPLAEGIEIQYVAVCDEETLVPVAIANARTRALLAVVVNGTRLIDNLAIAQA